jgi:hypothetical protein
LAMARSMDSGKSTCLTSTFTTFELDELLSSREKLNTRIQSILDQHTAPWGVDKFSVHGRDFPRVRRRRTKRDHIRRLKMGEWSRLFDVVEDVTNRIILWPALMLVEVGLELLFSFVGVGHKLRSRPEG